ncbi:LacI family DNA-binding transcriptional regulator [Alkalihalobacillus sp. 1P02AB]|uniref:LacI family DNA-binding transcriptional regulator n=1 Tax=Alkalihalobacillus sp. 1P02AB TaxID=3132260 RepID=UPI0039A533C8
MARLKDIAEHVGVSISTVSRVIKNDTSRNVHQETRRKIWEAVKELGYVPNENARSLVSNVLSKSSKRTHKVGWVANLKSAEVNPYFSNIYSGVYNALSEAGYTFVNVYKEELQNETTLVKTIHESGIEGLILVEQLDDETLNYITKYVPVVGIDFFYTDKDMSVIDYDRISAVKKAVQYLVAKGHTEIGFIGGGTGENYKDFRAEKRYRGYRYAMEEAGLLINPKWVVNTCWKLDSSYEGMKKIIANSNVNIPSAMVCASDLLAIAAMRAVVAHKLSVPEDIAFIGIDNIELSKYSNPPLTTIAIPQTELGEMAAKTLIDHIEKRTVIHVKVQLPNQLVIRDSTN